MSVHRDLSLATARIWSPDQLAFQAWLALPSAARNPRSQRALAAMLEIREMTLSEWKRLPGFHDAVYDLAMQHLAGDLVPVLHAMVAEAKQGSLPHAQWLFDLAGRWSPRTQHEVGGSGGGPVRIVIETVDDRRAP